MHVNQSLLGVGNRSLDDTEDEETGKDVGEREKTSILVSYFPAATQSLALVGVAGVVVDVDAIHLLAIYLVNRQVEE